MTRVFVIYLVVTAIELFAFWLHREHPIIRPDYWNTVLLLGQLGMCYGGVEASRWLLRKSPVSKLPGPRNDWTKLWLWIGPIGGLLLAIACVKGYFIDQMSPSRLPGLLVVGHICGGALVWVIAAPWAMIDLSGDESVGFRERLLSHLGLASHVLGFCAYFMLFPAQTVPPVALLGSLFFFYFLLYYVMLSQLVLALVFKFWKPQPPEPAEAEKSDEIPVDDSVPTRYLEVEPEEPAESEDQMD